MSFSYKDILKLYVNGHLSGSCLNFSKCTLLTISHPNHSTNYFMESFHLENVDDLKDLGIAINSHLKYH